MSALVRKLPTRMVEKVWGRTQLPAPFNAPVNTSIGEIWFEPPVELPQLLVKYLFTSEKLSVQVHPSDANALVGEDGKEECWLVLDAEPDATLAIGFKQEFSREAVAAAALDGSIEDMLIWHEARAGDVFFLPPGTVHAIGPGLSLVEVQQTSDTTFRLYDYGRPRELHLKRGLEVADCVPYNAHNRGSVAERGQNLLSATHFRIDRIEGAPGLELAAQYDGPLLALPLSGKVGEQGGDETAEAGDCLFAERLDALDFSEAGMTLLTRPT